MDLFDNFDNSNKCNYLNDLYHIYLNLEHRLVMNLGHTGLERTWFIPLLIAILTYCCSVCPVTADMMGCGKFSRKSSCLIFCVAS